MTEYTRLDLPALIDLLASDTAAYTKMLSEGISTVEEISQCKEKIKLIQAAIQNKIDYPEK